MLFRHKSRKTAGSLRQRHRDCRLSTRLLFQSLAAIICLPLLSGCVEVFDKLPHHKWGFIDKSGKMVIPAKFDDVSRDQYGGCTVHHKPFCNFSEGLCGVRVGDKWGYIDYGGEFRIPLKYDNAGTFSEGLACVRLGTKYGYIDKEGKVVIPLKFDCPPQIQNAANANPDWDMTQNLIEPFEFNDGLAVAVTGKAAGYIDKSGSIVIPQIYSRAEPFFEGVASVMTSDAGLQALGKTFIDKSGKVVMSSSEKCNDFSENVFLSNNGRYDKNRRFFYLDKNGKRVFQQEFADARIFSEGLAAVAIEFSPGMLSKNYGYIDKKGKIVIGPQFEISGNNFAGNFQHGRAIVQSSKVVDAMGNIKNMHGVIDSKGNWIVSPKYSHISAYRDGLARAMDENKTVYLDMNGNVALHTDYVWGNSFSEGLAAIMDNSK